jgi:hypothetical protein
MIHEFNEQIKNLENSENSIREELNRNKKSYQKLIEEFGFIDELEKEINEMNKVKKESIVLDGNEAEDNEQGEEPIEVDLENKKRTKKRKVKNIYSNYINEKYFDYPFEMEELDELLKSDVII